MFAAEKRRLFSETQQPRLDKLTTASASVSDGSIRKRYGIWHTRECWRRSRRGAQRRRGSSKAFFFFKTDPACFFSPKSERDLIWKNYSPRETFDSFESEWRKRDLDATRETSASSGRARATARRQQERAADRPRRQLSLPPTARRRAKGPPALRAPRIGSIDRSRVARAARKGAPSLSFSFNTHTWRDRARAPRDSSPHTSRVRDHTQSFPTIWLTGRPARTRGE